MSKQRRIQVSLVALAAVVAGAVFLTSARGTRASDTPERVIVLTAKGYAFHDEGESGGVSNPPLRLKAGEKVRVVVRNSEAGDVEHNFKIPGLGVHCSKPILPGDEETVEFTVPKDGLYTYTCCSHPGMGGKIEIEGGNR
jgi:plastocyanin